MYTMNTRKLWKRQFTVVKRVSCTNEPRIRGVGRKKGWKRENPRKHRVCSPIARSFSAALWKQKRKEWRAYVSREFPDGRAKWRDQEARWSLTSRARLVLAKGGNAAVVSPKRVTLGRPIVLRERRHLSRRRYFHTHGHAQAFPRSRRRSPSSPASATK